MAKKRILSWLVAASLTLSLLPVSAFAALEDYDEYRDWGAHEVGKPEEKNEQEITDAIKDPLQEKLDEEVLEDGEKAANSLNDAAYDAIYAADSKGHKADEVAAGIPTEPAEGIGETPVPPSESDSVLQNADKAADAAENFQDAVTDAVTVKDEAGKDTGKTVDEVVGEVKRSEDGSIDTDNSSGAALEIARAADDAAAAATDAGDALTNAQAAVTNRDQAALDAAKAEATTAYENANTAFTTADTAYNTAKAAVDAAQAAYEAAVAALNAAGYRSSDDSLAQDAGLVDIETALTEAKTAVATAKTQLDAAEKARNEAEKQRDYAKVYAAIANALGTDYTSFEVPKFENDENGEQLLAWLQDPESGKELKPLLDAMKALREVSAKTQYGVDGDNAVTRENLSLEELRIAYQLLWSTGDDYYDAWNAFDSIYHDDANWTSWNEEKRQEQIEKVKELEKKYSIETGEEEDLLYKVVKYAIDGDVQDKVTLDTDALSSFADGINQYWQIEKFLDHDKPAEGQEGTWKELGEMGPITCEYKLKTNPGDEWKYETHKVTVTLKEDQDGSKSITVDGKTYTPETPEWDAYTALIRQQVATQLDSAKEEFFGRKYVSGYYDALHIWHNGYWEDSKFEKLKKQVNTLDPAEAQVRLNNARLLVGYMELLQYELPLRADEQAYLASKDLYNAVADQTSLMQMVLSDSQAGQDLLRQEWDQIKNTPESNIPEGMTFETFIGLIGKQYAIELARSLVYATEENAKYPEQKAMYGVMQNLIEKQEAAKGAEDELTKAVQAYDDAVKAAEAAQARLDKLLEKVENGDLSKFSKAVQNARQKLNDANTALNDAEAERKDAEMAQKAAQADYEEAMRLTIAAIDPNNPGGGTDTDTGDDGTTALEDALVPLALMPTRGELMNYLYERAGSPAAQAPTFTDVPADHEFAAAIGWAQENGIATGYADGTFDPDNFVVASAMTAFLTRYAAFANMEMPTLTSMAGLEDYDIVDNADEILAEFFGEEYVPAEGESDTVA